MKMNPKILILILLTPVLLTACLDRVPIDDTSSNTPTGSSSLPPLPNGVGASTPNTASSYQREILYNGVPILPFVGTDISTVMDVLGEPLDITSRPPSTKIAGIYVYDKLYFHVDEDASIGYITLSPVGCTMNGVTLDKNRAELITILGNPKSEAFDQEGEFGNSMLLDYELQGCDIRFCLKTPEENAYWMEIYDKSNDFAMNDVRVNTEIFDNFSLTYDGILKKYGPIIDAYYWEGGLYVKHKNGLGEYFYQFTDESFWDTENIKAIQIRTEAKIKSTHCHAETLFKNMPDKMDIKLLNDLFRTNNIQHSEDESGYFGNAVIRFTYNGFNFTIGCNNDGSINKDSTVFIRKIQPEENQHIKTSFSKYNSIVVDSFLLGGNDGKKWITSEDIFPLLEYRQNYKIYVNEEYVDTEIGEKSPIDQTQAYIGERVRLPVENEANAVMGPPGNYGGYVLGFSGTKKLTHD